jgi:tetratricopeptide (TPR) repeat protein
LEQTFREYPNANDRALAYDCAGRCCALLGRSEDALTYYRRALEREREYPGLGTNAPFHLAELVAKQNRTDLFDEVLNALDTFGAPVFPWHAYYDRGFRALVAATRGNAEAARRLAREALQAAAVKDTGLGWGRGALGTVTLGEIDDGFHASLARIGRPNK